MAMGVYLDESMQLRLSSVFGDEQVDLEELVMRLCDRINPGGLGTDEDRQRVDQVRMKLHGLAVMTSLHGTIVPPVSADERPRSPRRDERSPISKRLISRLRCIAWFDAFSVRRTRGSRSALIAVSKQRTVLRLVSSTVVVGMVLASERLVNILLIGTLLQPLRVQI